MKKINPTIILVRPQLYENIGLAARAMDNFGLSKLSIVSPRDGWPSKKAESSAKHADKIINRAKVYDHLEDAVSNFDLLEEGEKYVVTGGVPVGVPGTTNYLSVLTKT